MYNRALTDHISCSLYTSNFKDYNSTEVVGNWSLSKSIISFSDCDTHIFQRHLCDPQRNLNTRKDEYVGYRNHPLNAQKRSMN